MSTCGRVLSCLQVMLVEDPLAGLKDIEACMEKFVTYPGIKEKLDSLAAHRKSRAEKIQDELAVLRQSSDITRVNAALGAHIAPVIAMEFCQTLAHPRCIRQRSTRTRRICLTPRSGTWSTTWLGCARG